VVPAGGEERAQRPVDEARGEDLLLGGPALALEEAARDAPRRVGLLLVVDGEREEILARLDLAAADAGHQHHGVVHGHEHGAVGLAGDLSRLERHLVAAERKCLLDRFHDGILFI
jgi:hypothetical protein